MIAYLLLGAYGFAAGAQAGQLQAYLIGRAVAHGWRSRAQASDLRGGLKAAAAHSNQLSAIDDEYLPGDV